MTAVLAGTIGRDRSVIPRLASRHRPVHGVPAGGILVLEDDAAALVVDVAVALALRGKNPVITPANERRLVRLGALMLDAYGVGTEVKEENDEPAHHARPV